ncbi:hypothetical protein [Crocosphaera watsonii]|uniref:hypothetical protein n=1 Tax=Crocosphaera watsonii TaxID=263511 RepID=UPI000B215BB2|nr:hypothetical protein [Crocosphaera watsonii]
MFSLKPTLRSPTLRGLTKSEVRSQKFLTTFRHYRTEVVFETEIYAPLQKLCALKGGVLDPTIFDKFF